MTMTSYSTASVSDDGLASRRLAGAVDVNCGRESIVGPALVSALARVGLQRSRALRSAPDRRSEKTCRPCHSSAQRAQERLELLQFPAVQSQRLQFRGAGRRGGSAVVVIE